MKEEYKNFSVNQLLVLRSVKNDRQIVHQKAVALLKEEIEDLERLIEKKGEEL